MHLNQNSNEYLIRGIILCELRYKDNSIVENVILIMDNK